MRYLYRRSGPINLLYKLPQAETPVVLWLVHMPRALAREHLDKVCSIISWRFRKLGAFPFYYTTPCVSSLLSKSRLTRSLPFSLQCQRKTILLIPITNRQLSPLRLLGNGTCEPVMLMIVESNDMQLSRSDR